MSTHQPFLYSCFYHPMHSVRMNNVASTNVSLPYWELLTTWILQFLKHLHLWSHTDAFPFQQETYRYEYTCHKLWQVALVFWPSTLRRSILLSHSVRLWGEMVESSFVTSHNVIASKHAA